MPTFPEHGYVETDGDNQTYYWKASTLWKLAEQMDVEDVPLDSFDWTNGNFQCNSLSDPPLWRDIGDHAKRIMKADLQYPIIINSSGDVMDGMHRILKAYISDMPTIKAVRFTQDPAPDIIFPAEDA